MKLIIIVFKNDKVHCLTVFDDNNYKPNNKQKFLKITQSYIPI